MKDDIAIGPFGQESLASRHDLQILNQSRQIVRCLIGDGCERVEHLLQSFVLYRPNCGAFAAFVGYLLRGKVAAPQASNQTKDPIRE